MVMDNDIVVTLSMDCFTMKDSRITDIKCVFGEITVQDNMIRARDFNTGEESVWDFSSVAGLSLHAGADLKIVEEFIGKVRASKETECTDKAAASGTPEISNSMESHRICFMAEESRLSGMTVSDI